MAQDTRTLIAGRTGRGSFRGLGALTQSQSLLAQDQTLKKQIQLALAGQPVPGNPFPNATPQQLALALAGSTSGQPWNQSGTIEKAVANTVARFASEGGSDAILRSLQIAAGSPVTVGASTPGVNVTKDPTTTASMKLGLAALLGTTVPVSSGGSTSAPAAPVTIQPNAQGVMTVTPSIPVAPAQPNAQGVLSAPAPATGATTAATPVPTTLGPNGWIDQYGNPIGAQGSPAALNAVLGAPTPAIDPTTGLPIGSIDPTTGLPVGSAALAAAGAALAATGVQPVASSPGIMDLLSAPIVLPVIGSVPTGGVLLALAAGIYAWTKRKASA